MVKIHPTTGFCGCLTLTFGVQLSCCSTIARIAFALYVVSAKERLYFLGVTITPMVQLCLTSWMLFGAPLTAMAAIASIFRFEHHLRNYFYYMAVTYVLDFFSLMHILVTGRLCSAIVPDYIARLGSGFVCTTIGMQSAFWMLVYLIFSAYMLFVVWSLYAVFRKGEFTELLQYEYVDPDAPLFNDIIRFDSDHGGMGKNAHLPVGIAVQSNGHLNKQGETIKPGAPPGFQRWEGPDPKALRAMHEHDAQRWPGLYQGPPATSMGWQPPLHQNTHVPHYGTGHHEHNAHGDPYNGIAVVSQSHSVLDPHHGPPPRSTFDPRYGH